MFRSILNTMFFCGLGVISFNGWAAVDCETSSPTLCQTIQQEVTNVQTFFNSGDESTILNGERAVGSKDWELYNMGAAPIIGIDGVVQYTQNNFLPLIHLPGFQLTLNLISVMDMPKDRVMVTATEVISVGGQILVIFDKVFTMGRRPPGAQPQQDAYGASYPYEVLTELNVISGTW